MTDGILERLAARATFAGQGQLDATRTAAAGGDESWREWLDQHARGDALLLTLHVTATYLVPGREGRVSLVNDGVWAENDLHPPAVQEQVRELVYKDVSLLSAQLAEHGVRVGEEELTHMYIEVELAPEVRAAVGRESARLTRDPTVGPGAAGWAEA